PSRLPRCPQRSSSFPYTPLFRSPELADAMHEGANSEGMDTLDIGMVPTPLVYFAANVHETGSGVAITGSHNPPDYNGFKMMLARSEEHTSELQSREKLVCRLLLE